MHLGRIRDGHGPAARQCSDLPDHPPPLQRWKSGNEADRRYPRREGFGIEDLGVRELPLLSWPEQWRAPEGGTPGSGPVGGCVAAMRRNDRLDRLVDRFFRQAAVPDERERTAGTQHTVN